MEDGRMKVMLGQKEYSIPRDTTRKIYLHGTGDCILVDEEDFQRSKDTRWYLKQGQVVNAAGVSFQKYNKIVFKRRKDAPKLDYRRKWF